MERHRRMRDPLAHHCFDTDHAVVVDVVDQELPGLLTAVETLSHRLTEGGSTNDL
jgi:uncharacterized protein with HEPN domain